MATKAAVAVGLLPTSASGTVDLTVSGFGTVSAAIVIASYANSTNNPQDDQAFSVGFWDGVNSAQHEVNVASENGQGTSDTGRGHLATKILELYSLVSTGQIIIDATCSAVTDGIRLTVGTSNTGLSCYVTAILIGGATDVHLASQNLGTGTSAIDITAPGFEPDIVFLLTAGTGIGTSGGSASIFSFGVVHNSSGGTVTQGAVHSYSEDNQGTSDAGSYTTNSYCIGQYFNGAISWQASASDFDASGFSLTPTASTASDDVSYLAIKLADPDDAWIAILDSATSTGNSSQTGLGFEPQVVGLLPTVSETLNTGYGDQIISFGAGDGTRQRTLLSYDDNARNTSLAASVADTSNILNGYFGFGSSDFVASLSSLDSDGFTLNYSDAATTAKKILAFAIGDSTAGAGFSPYWAAGSNVIMNNGSP